MISCAVCASDRGPFALEPLGRDDAMVNVCAACSTEPAREDQGPDRGFQPRGGFLSREESTAGCIRAMGEEEYRRLSIIEEEYSMAPGTAVDPSENDIVNHERESERRRRTGSWRARGPRSR